MTLGEFVKRALGLCGIEAYSYANLRPGLKLERDLQRIFVDETKPVIFDVGANFGQTAARFVQTFGTADIWCFEPIAATFATLTRNVAGQAHIRPHQLALGDRDGEADMLLFSHPGWSRLADATDNTAGQPVERVRLARIDTFCREQGLDHLSLLKTDCEGHDLDALRGAEQMLAAGRIDAVFCEVNLRRNGMHGDFFAIHDYLVARGFYFYAIYDYEGWGRNFAEGAFQNALWLRLARFAGP